MSDDAAELAIARGEVRTTRIANENLRKALTEARERAERAERERDVLKARIDRAIHRLVDLGLEVDAIAILRGEEESDG